MSTQEQTLAEVIEQHLKQHPFGKTEAELVDALPDQYTVEEIRETLERLETNDVLIHVNGTWRWTG